MPELRQNPVNKHWVILAHERAFRPKNPQFPRVPSSALVHDVATCPFEEGKESLTPPEVLAFPDDAHPNRAENSPGWLLRVFPNKYPDLENAGDFKLSNQGIDALFPHAPAVGFHEIVVRRSFAPSPGLFSVDETFLFLKAYRERILFYQTMPFIRYTQVFYNHGQQGGSSLAHPHAQLIALPIISHYISQELHHEHEYLKEWGTCGHCALVSAEVGFKKRVIYSTDRVVSFAPYASRDPFEISIFPIQHASRFEDSDDDLLRDMAVVLQDALSRLHEKLHNPALNYYIHTAPHHSGDYQYSHWHLKILPRITTRAGFELATGVVVNVVAPEQAAAFLRGEKEVV